MQELYLMDFIVYDGLINELFNGLLKEVTQFDHIIFFLLLLINYLMK